VEAGDLLSVHSLVGTGCVGLPPPLLALLQHRRRVSPPSSTEMCHSGASTGAAHRGLASSTGRGSWGRKGLPCLSLGVQRGYSREETILLRWRAQIPLLLAFGLLARVGTSCLPMSFNLVEL